MDQAEALRVAYEIIDAQARLIESFQSGRWSDRKDRALVAEKLPQVNEYRDQTPVTQTYFGRSADA
jgi:hypothetical protein